MKLTRMKTILIAAFALAITGAVARSHSQLRLALTSMGAPDKW